MITNYENIRVGGWYVVVQKPDEEIITGGMFGGTTTTTKKAEYNGHPFKILGVTIPFIFVEPVGCDEHTLDLRVYSINSVNDGYVKAFIKAFQRKGREVQSSPPRKKKRRRKDESEATCPRCRCPYRQILKVPEVGWRWTCPECDFDGGPVNPALIVPSPKGGK